MAKPVSLLALFLVALCGFSNEHVFTEAERGWWAVQALANPRPPDAGQNWARNPVDRFVARQHARASFEPLAEASKEVLLRRAVFDLHGLPPTPEQRAAFLADERPEAFDHLVDQLLASPRYGEHWAQHWLDVVRYSETDGYRADFFRPGAHRYRDWVVRGLNQDMPYDEFVRLQLAGDELGDTLDARIATGFLRHGVYEHNQRDARSHWQIILDEVTRTTGEAFLGLGIGCAQCHDHKFDPILQADYVALQAFFSTMAWPTDEVAAERTAREDHAAARSSWEEATAPIRFEMDAMLASTRASKADYQVRQFPPDIQAMYAKPATERTSFEAQMVALVQRQVDQIVDGVTGSGTFKKDKEKLARWKALEAELQVFESMKPTDLPAALVATDIAPRPVEALLKTREGDRPVPPGLLAILKASPPTVNATDSTTGRRSALAKWITRSDNRLSTRVIANRLWQHHFGTGLVATPNDFGTLGEAPSHPELLDWLAREVVRREWKLKPMHRLLMTSATYRQDSLRAADDQRARLLAGFPSRRLRAEQVRDAMLLVSGELDTRLGGPSVSGETPRRSVYVTRRRNRPDPVLAAFDAPSGFDSAPTRQNTATPTQSLLLSNNPWPRKRATAFANVLLKEKTDADIVRRAYLRAYGRLPAEDEATAAIAFLAASHDALLSEASEPAPKAGAFVTTAKAYPKVHGLGSHALQLGPKNPNGHGLEVDSDWTDSDFTIQAVARLDGIHPNAHVNTLASRWLDKNRQRPGWTFGVTSKRSSYEPRNLIMQLVGENKDGNVGYEVVDSNIEIPLGVPVFLAAVVRTDVGGGTVTFYAKDLSRSDGPVMVNRVKHGMVGAIQHPDSPMLLGVRDAPGHTFDGSLARLVLSPGELRLEELLAFADSAPDDAVLDWTFDGSPVDGGQWFGEAARRESSVRREAISDFCHALLMSNEFLYLD